MRRVLAGLLSVLALAGGAAALSGAGGEGEPFVFKVELDNAFGLIQGGDVKIAGVRAGQVKSIELDMRSKRALVELQVDRTGFGDIRQDVRCETRPQSLIGEYFVDCQPGTSPQRFPAGGTVPVERTTSTIPPDLVGNILRLPYRQRLRILLAELGAGVGGRGAELNDAIRRAVPALRETDKVLRILADESRTLQRLTADSDEVISALNGNRRDVSRFIDEAGDAARISAERQDALAEQFRRLPGFLQELRPTMRSLGQVADEQTPLLRNLAATAGELGTFFDLLGPFARASRPSLRSLGRAGVTGRRALRAAQPTIGLLRRYADTAPEVGANLSRILRDLDDRDRAVEPDPRSPGGKGFTGLEALLQYVYWQSQSINIFDADSYYLKVSAFLDEVCGPYPSVEDAQQNPQCRVWLGPNQIGINRRDPTRGTTEGGVPGRDGEPDPETVQTRSRERTGDDEGDGGSGTGGGGDRSGPGGQGDRPRLPDAVERLLDGLPGLGGRTDGLLGRGGRSGGSTSGDDSQVLDLLFG